MPAYFPKINPFEQVLAPFVKKFLDAWHGTSGAGVPLRLTAMNDADSYALEIKNTGSGGKGLRVYDSAGVLVCRADDAGFYPSGGGSGFWERTGTTVHLTTPTDNVVVGQDTHQSYGNFHIHGTRLRIDTSLTPRNPYYPAVLADAPVGYWRLGESSGTTATDSSGTGNNATYSGSGVTYSVAGLISGVADTAVTFSGTGSQLNLNSALGGFGTLGGSFTIEFWYNFASQVAASGLYAFDVGLSPRFVLRHHASSASWEWADNSNTRLLSAVGTYAQRHHIACVVSTQTIQTYIDGVAGSLVDMGSGFNFGQPFTSQVSFGSSWDEGANLPGTFDELAFYDYALSASRIAEHYAVGTSPPSGTGYAGEYCWDTNYLYICVDTDIWKSVPLSYF